MQRAMACLAFLAAAVSCHSKPHTVLTVSVAASLSGALEEIESAYQRSHPGVEFRNNFGASGTLAREIEHGAPVDLFFSAAAKPMDELEAQHAIVPGTRRNILRNTLVLIAPADSKLSGFEQLTGKAVRAIAIGDPGSVPAGQYGQQTLEALHLFDRVHAKLVLTKDVRQVLTYVETGNADAGIVYGTDAAISSKVRVVATAPETSHQSIIYPAAVTAASKNRAAAIEFEQFLASPGAQSSFTKHGFTVTAQ